MILAFELSMPTANSWNGRWSGEGRCYARLETFRGVKGGQRAAEILAKAPYYYHWSDGWSAAVSVREVTPAEARTLRKKSVGMAGYDWMVETIRLYGKILADHEVGPFLEQQRAAKEAAVTA